MSDQDWAIDFLNGLDKNKLQALLKVCALITDPLSQELIKRAADDSQDSEGST